MSTQAWGVRFCCDLCGVTADSPAAPAEGLMAWASMPRPTGWLALEPDIGLRLTDLYMTQVQHLCPVCSLLDLEQIAGKLRAKVAAQS